MATTIQEQVKAAYPDVSMDVIEEWYKSAVEYGMPLTVEEFADWLASPDA